MSKNPNFHNMGGRPVFNNIYENDKLLCYAREKSRALLGYFALSPIESVQMDDCGSGQVILNINNERISIQSDSTLRHITISKIDENGKN